MNSISVRRQRRIDFEVLNVQIPQLQEDRPSELVDSFFIRDCNVLTSGFSDSEILAFGDLGFKVFIRTTS